MGNWINKHFRKASAVKVLLSYPDHRTTEHYVIPKGDFITIKDQTFTIDKEKIYFDQKRFPTVWFRYDSIEALDPLTGKSTSTKTPKELNTQAESKLASDFIKGMGGGFDMNMILLIGLGIVLFAMIFGFYTMWSEIKDIKEVLGGFLNG